MAEPASGSGGSPEVCGNVLEDRTVCSWVTQAGKQKQVTADRLPAVLNNVTLCKQEQKLLNKQCLDYTLAPADVTSSHVWNEKTPVLNVVNLGQLKRTNKYNLFINNSSRDTSAANHQQNNAKIYTAVEVDNTKSLRQTKLSQENKNLPKRNLR